jgi:chromate transporter
MTSSMLIQLFFVVAPLSLVAVGGANTIIPELNRQTVGTHGWVTAEEFAAIYAIAQMAPGPNAMVVSLIGWHIAGWMGAVVAGIAVVAPSSLLAYVVYRLGRRESVKPWLVRIQRGLAPLAVGLMVASGFIVAQGVNATVASIAVTVISLAVFSRTTLHPVPVMAAGAIIAIAGLM